MKKIVIGGITSNVPWAERRATPPLPPFRGV
jgi:hypothetical protein